MDGSSMVQRLRNISAWLSMWACLGLAACGGDEAAPQRSTTATVGTAGGTLQVDGFGGGSLVLQIPADALAGDTTVTLSSLATDGLVDRFNVQPAGLLLRAKATLRYAPAGTLPEHTVLRWRDGARQVPLSTRRVDGRLVAETAYLGYTFSAQASAARERRAMAPAQPPGEDASTALEVAPLDCDTELGELGLLLRSAVDVGNETEASAIYERVQAVVTTCVAQRVVEIERQACDAYDSAALRAQVTAADSYAALKSLIAPLMATMADVQVTGAKCSESSPALGPILEQKFAQFSSFLAAEYAKPGFGNDYQSARQELRRLYDYLAVCDLMALTQACAQMRSTLFPDYFDRLREGGYRACRSDGDLVPLATMYTEDLVFRRVLQSDRERPQARSGAYLDLGRFTYGALEADLAHCRSALDVKAFDDARGVPVQEATTVMQPGADPGSAPEPVELEIPRNGSLTLGGQVQVLRCPDGSAGFDRLVARIGSTEVGSRGISGNRFMVDSQPFDLVLTDTLVQAQLDPAMTARFTVELFREGDACGGTFSRQFKLYSINVNVRPIGLSITPSSATVAPDGTIRFTPRLTGTGSTSVSWNASAGTIDANGMYRAPATPGTAIITAAVADVPSVSATASLSIAAAATVAGRYSGTATDLSKKGDGTLYNTVTAVTQQVRQSGNRIAISTINPDGSDRGFGPVLDVHPDGTLAFLGLSTTKFGFGFNPTSSGQYFGTLVGTQLDYFDSDEDYDTCSNRCTPDRYRYQLTRQP